VPGHDNLLWINTYAGNAGSLSVSDERAYTSLTCGHCGRDVAAAVLIMTSADANAPQTKWLRCVNCGGGLVLTPERGLLPAARPGANLEGLPGDVRRAYDEARSTASVNAWTSVEMMCRKILMHVAVDKGAKGNQTFAAYLTYLQEKGYISPVMAGWVDLIRKHGNEAVHELPEVSEQRARSTLIFTEQLLRMTYEMDALAQRFAPPSSES
jgi:hypothetical protein